MFVFFPEESKRAQWHWAAEMEGEGQDSVDHCGVTYTERLDQAMLSMNQSINTVHRNSIGCLGLEVKDAGFSAHLLT